jgi:hypothetical protein
VTTWVEALLKEDDDRASARVALVGDVGTDVGGANRVAKVRPE